MREICTAGSTRERQAKSLVFGVVSWQKPELEPLPGVGFTSKR